MKRSDHRFSKKGKAVQLAEYAAASALLSLAQCIPLGVLPRVGRVLGDLFYLLIPKRRGIAAENVRQALQSSKSDDELARITRESFRYFILTYLEIMRFQKVFRSDDSVQEMKKYAASDLDALFRKAKSLHEESGGCIFVTPHIGNWEFLPSVSGAVGIPLVVVARPLDNVYLERRLYRSRTERGQLVIPKRNALFTLQKSLQGGKSIGMLPDQSTAQGIPVDFFGRKAMTTPVPALLAITYQRPVVVVACCRRKDSYSFEGIVADPVYPGTFSSEKEEIYRITSEMNRLMESVVREFPEQYLWMHNRWKTYTHKKPLLT